MFYCLVVFPPLLFVNLFNAQLVVEELWLRAFIAEVVVVVEDYQSFSHLPTPPTFAILHPHAQVFSHTELWLFSSRACSLCPWCVLSIACSLTLTRFWSVAHTHTQALGVFGSHAGFVLLPHELLKHPRTVNSRPSCCVCIPGRKRSRFSSRRASIVCPFPCWFGSFNHAQVSLTAVPFILTQRSVRPHAEKSGMYFPCILLLGVSSSTRTGCLGRFPM